MCYDLAVCGIEPLRSYHEITIYDITDKTSPRKQKTFTLRGTSESTRISEGYFYGKFFQILKAFQKGCLLKTVLSIQDLDALLFSVRRTVLFFCLFSGYLVQVAAIVFDAVGLVYSVCPQFRNRSKNKQQRRPQPMKQPLAKPTYKQPE